MSPRSLAALIAMLAALGGAVAIANPSSLGLRLAQTPTTTPSPNASSSMSPDSKPPGAKDDGWLKDLNLSADQVQQMHAIRGQYKDKLSQGRQSVRQSQQELRSLMAGDAPETQVREKYSQLRTLKQTVADTQFESMLATRKILTLEQRHAFAERMKKQRPGNDHRPDRDEPRQN